MNLQSDEFTERLVSVGFFATANDYAGGYADAAIVVARLRRDAPNVREPWASMRLALADDMEASIE